LWSEIGLACAYCWNNIAVDEQSNNLCSRSSYPRSI